mgnify:CR=1 FL=1
MFHSRSQIGVAKLLVLCAFLGTFFVISHTTHATTTATSTTATAATSTATTTTPLETTATSTETTSSSTTVTTSTNSATSTATTSATAITPHSTTSTTTLPAVDATSTDVLSAQTLSEPEIALATTQASITPVINHVSTTTILTKDRSPYLITRSIRVLAGGTLIIEPGVVVKFARTGSGVPTDIVVHGNIVVNGTEDEVVYFTSERDDSLAGDTNNDADATAPGPGYWKQIRIMPDGEGNISHAEFRYGGYGHGGLSRCMPGITWCQGSLMNAGLLEANNVVIKNSLQYSFHNLGGEAVFSNSYFDGVRNEQDVELYITYGTTTVRNSAIIGISDPNHTTPGRGVILGNYGYADMRENWWGDPSGPREPVNNPLGTGTRLDSSIVYQPFLTEDPFSEPSCDGVCASSVLFLPGIQASRLYTKEADGTEKLLWEPDYVFEDDDVLRLQMTEEGESVESVYVRDVIDFAPQTEASKDAIYGGFINFLGDLVASETIKEFEAFAYDWRYDVYDIVEEGVQYENERRYVDAVIEDLASDSLSGKVTIVAHSNGGMLGKALLDELEATDRIELVDKFIMIGTPQLGTPKAIGSLLHGTDQGLSYDVFAGITLPVISDAAVRQAARNMPGVYGLLPGQTYFDAANDIITIFDTSPITEVWRDAYGNTLNTQAELDDFLVSTSNNRDSVLYQSTNEAIVANPTILSKARETRSKQDAWRPPASVEVTSVVGTGRNTISGFWYEAFSQQICDESSHGCDLLDIYKPVPIISQRGDQTVMVASAESNQSGSSNYYFDMKRAEQATAVVTEHSNFTESQTVQSLIESLLLSTSTESQFVSSVEPEYDDQQLLLGTHSPVYLYIEDSEGRRTGQLDADTVVTEIPDTEWFSHASSSYVIAPEDLEFTVRVDSFGDGVMTFTSHTFSSEGQDLQHKVPLTTLTKDSTITVNYDGSTFTPLAVDEDGDGERDYQITLDGGRIDVPTEEVTYAVVQAYLKDNVTRRIVRPLGKLLTIAEYFSTQSHPYAIFIERRMLTRFEQTITWLYQRGRLSEDNYAVLLEYVKELNK